MDNKMMTARANFYRFLSRLYLLEVDEALWNAMQNMTFPVDAAEGDMKAGFPYESVYTSRKHLVMQDSRMDVVELYAKRGVAPSKDNYHVPEDHLGYLCEYMAILIDEGAADEQKAFLKNHLLNWVSAFTVDMGKYAATDFYGGLAKLTRGFLLLEQEIMK